MDRLGDSHETGILEPVSKWSQDLVARLITKNSGHVPIEDHFSHTWIGLTFRKVASYKHTILRKYEIKIVIVLWEVFLILFHIKRLFR